MTFADFNANTNQIFINVGLLKVRDINPIIKCNQLKLVYNFFNKDLPTDLMTLFQSSAAAHTTKLQLNSNIKSLLFVPRIRTQSYGNQSLKYRCPQLWNEFFATGIAIDNVSANNVTFDKLKSGKHFQEVLKRHFLYKYSIEDDDDFIFY